MALKKTVGIGIATLMFVATAQAHDGKYVQDSSGASVKDSYKNCVMAKGGNMLDCEAVEEAAPAPAPAVAPTPRRAPAPVVPKVKAKGNYKGAVQMDPAQRSTMQRYQQ